MKPLALFLALCLSAFGQYRPTPNPGDPLKLAANPAVGTPPYSTQTITASPMTITNVTHGQGARAFPECFTGAGPWTGSSCSYTVASNGDLVITYTVAPTRIDVFGATGGFANPMTTAGDIILGGAAGVATRSTLLGAGIVAGAGALSTTGAVPFVTSSGVLGQNSLFCFDNANTRLGVGTCTPGEALHISHPSRTLVEMTRAATVISYFGEADTLYGGGASSSDFGFLAQSGKLMFGTLIGGVGTSSFTLSSGAVGIGPNNLNPSGTLHIFDARSVTGATSVLIQAGAGDASGAKLLRGVLNNGTTETWSITAGGAGTFSTVAAVGSFTTSDTLGANSGVVETKNTGIFGWSSVANATATIDTGLSRISAGVIGIGNGTGGNTSGQLQYASSQWINTAAQPACAVGTRGTVWYVAGGAGVKDTFNICAQDATSTFAWRTIY